MVKPIVVIEHFDAPPERAFDIATDIPRWAERIGAIDRIEPHAEGPVGVGTHFTETRTMMGKQASETMTVTAYDPPRRWVLEARSHGAQYTTTTTFTPEAEGTRLEMRFSAEATNLSGRVMQLLMGWSMRGYLRKCLAKDLADLKAFCENADAPPGASPA